MLPYFVVCVVLCSVVLLCILCVLMCAGMNKLDEKLKVGRTKRSEGTPFIEESQKKQPTLVPAKRELPCRSQGKQMSPSVSLALVLPHYLLDIGFSSQSPGHWIQYSDMFCPL